MQHNLWTEETFPTSMDLLVSLIIQTVPPYTKSSLPIIPCTLRKQPSVKECYLAILWKRRNCNPLCQ